MHNDSKAILDDILSRWHAHCKGYNIAPSCGSDPMFKGAKSGGWDGADDVMDAAINRKIMQAVDFEVGELLEPYRSAIYVTARNLCTGRAVWNSPRLPVDAMERGVIVVEAKRQITKRLMCAGVI